MDISIGDTRKYFKRLVLFIKQSKRDCIDNGRGENLSEREGDIWKKHEPRIEKWWVAGLVAITILSLRTKTWNDETPI